MSTRELFDRSAQDDLLSIRNDLMTVYREFSADDDRLFPLRYARTTPRHPWPQDLIARRGTAPPEAPLLIIPDGPGGASVLPYFPMRRTLAARGLDVLMMEHRGVGLSRLDSTGQDLPIQAVRVAEVIDDLVAVLDHAKVERASVYGCGYGGYLAQALAALHPERVHSLVLDSALTSRDDEVIGQRALRTAYWDGDVPATSTIASVLRRLGEEGVVDVARGGPVVLAVHEHGGPDAVRDLVDLLAVGRGRLTWSSVRQVLAQDWLQSTPYVVEHDLAAGIAHTELGMGRHADGGPLDPLVLSGARARALPAAAQEPYDLHALAREIQAPTLVVAGARDLVRPVEISRDLAARIPGAALLELPGVGDAILDSREHIAQIAARWASAGMGPQLASHAAQLAALPATPTDQTLARGLRLALVAERHSPWRLWVESARRRRQDAQVDPLARRARTVRM
ncbi:alpha/beta fold hydrolase [Brachybacterium sp. DNPG3]